VCSLYLIIPALNPVQCVNESDRLITVPGHAPFRKSLSICTATANPPDLYERWSTGVDWNKTESTGWFQFIDGLQAITPSIGSWITCFPSSIVEPEALDAVRADGMMTDSGKKEYREMGWFELAPKEDWGPGVREFLDKHEEKSVVYVRWAQSTSKCRLEDCLRRTVSVQSSTLALASRRSSPT